MNRLIYLLSIILFFCNNFGHSQSVGISEDGSIPNSSSILDLKSTTKGLLVPRMTTAQRTSIPLPATGLIVYDTDLGAIYVNTGTTTVPVWEKEITSGNNNSWGLSGNEATTAGTNFLGTTDAQDLVLKTNATERLRILSTGNIGLGTNNPSTKLHIKSSSDPVRIDGMQNSTDNDSVLTINDSNIIYKTAISDLVSCDSTGNIWYVSINGDNSNCKKGYTCLPCADPWAAKDSANSGDQIIVSHGTYTSGNVSSGAMREGTEEETSLCKNGVSYNFNQVSFETINGYHPLFYDLSGGITKIKGLLNYKSLDSTSSLIQLDSSSLISTAVFDTIDLQFLFKIDKQFNEVNKLYIKNFIFRNNGGHFKYTNGYGTVGSFPTERSYLDIEIEKQYKSVPTTGFWQALAFNNATVKIKFHSLPPRYGFDCYLDSTDFYSDILTNKTSQPEREHNGIIFDWLKADNNCNVYIDIKNWISDSIYSTDICRFRPNKNDGNFFFNCEDCKAIDYLGSNAFVNFYHGGTAGASIGKFVISGNYFGTSMDAVSPPFSMHNGNNVDDTKSKLIFKNVNVSGFNDTFIGHIGGAAAVNKKIRISNVVSDVPINATSFDEVGESITVDTDF